VRKQQLKYQRPILLFSYTTLACGFICENSVADNNHGNFGEKSKADKVLHCCSLWKTLQLSYPFLTVSTSVLLCPYFRDRLNLSRICTTAQWGMKKCHGRSCTGEVSDVCEEVFCPLNEQ